MRYFLAVLSAAETDAFIARIVAHRAGHWFGLEAAFFVGVDQLERDHPSNFERYLYVGATRAATFLAFTASDRLPTQFAEIRDVMRSNWG